MGVLAGMKVNGAWVLGMMLGLGLSVLPLAGMGASVRVLHRREPVLLRDPGQDSRLYAFVRMLGRQSEQQRLLKIFPLVPNLPKTVENAPPSDCTLP
jgi:hypothetical protein